MIVKSSGHKNQILFLRPFQNIWAKAKIEHGQQDKPSWRAVVSGSLKQAGRPELPGACVLVRECALLLSSPPHDIWLSRGISASGGENS